MGSFTHHPLTHHPPALQDGHVFILFGPHVAISESVRNAPPEPDPNQTRARPYPTSSSNAWPRLIPHDSLDPAQSRLLSLDPAQSRLISQGEIGKHLRIGQTKHSAACGALLDALDACRHGRVSIH